MGSKSNLDSFSDRESLPEAGAHISKQETCPGSARQEEGTSICEECWSGI